MFKRPFSFHGRIRRMELWLSYLICLLCIIPFSLIVFLAEELFRSINYLESEVMVRVLSALSVLVGVLVLACPIAACWFLMAQRAKRCHDLGNSGWFQLIPFYGFIMLLADGNPGTNVYGDNPKDA